MADPYDVEDQIQSLLAAYPDLLPGDQITKVTLGGGCWLAGSSASPLKMVGLFGGASTMSSLTKMARRPSLR